MPLQWDQPAPREAREAVECAFCGLHLPIDLARPQAKGAVSVSCARCGNRHWAFVWPDAPEEIAGNARVERKDPSK